MASGYPDYEGTKSKLFTVSDWAAVRATDKNFTGTAVNKTRGTGVISAYAVPTGSTLYITGASFDIYSNAAADYDHFLHGQIGLKSGATYLCRLGGIGGKAISFDKPLVIAGGTNFNIEITTQANVACNLGYSVWGYEL